jgi:hypothetical protein
MKLTPERSRADTPETKGNTQALFDRLRKVKLSSSQHMVNRTAPRKPQHA